MSKDKQREPSNTPFTKTSPIPKSKCKVCGEKFISQHMLERHHGEGCTPRRNWLRRFIDWLNNMPIMNLPPSKVTAFIPFGENEFGEIFDEDTEFIFDDEESERMLSHKKYNLNLGELQMEHNRRLYDLKKDYIRRLDSIKKKYANDETIEEESE